MLLERYDRKATLVTTHVRNFLEQSGFTQGTAKNLRNLVDISNESLSGLKALERESRDPFLIYILLRKLDQDTRTLWNQESVDEDNPTVDMLLKFLSRRCVALEASQMVVGKSQTLIKATNIHSMHATTYEHSLSCLECKGEHPIAQCPIFLTKNIHERRDYILSKNICFNCLKPFHSSKKCRSRFRCNTCKAKHHTTLCLDHKGDKSSSDASEKIMSINKEENEQTPPANESRPYTNSFTIESSTLNEANPPSQVSFHSAQVSPPPSVVCTTLLPTAVVQIKDKFGKFRPCRILLDSGSESSFITESLLQALNLPRKNARVLVKGVSNNPVTTKGVASIEICSSYNETCTLSVNALILDDLQSCLPSAQFSVRDWQYLNGLKLADPQFNKPRHIDMLVGADHFFKVIQEGRISGPPGTPTAVNTLFGWIVAGEITSLARNKDSIISYHTTLQNIDKSLRSMWENEEIPTKKLLTPEEIYCEEHFKVTHSRTPSGRFISRLPFRSNVGILGNSSAKAISQFHGIERRMINDPDYKRDYVKVMQELQHLGHMFEIPPAEIKCQDDQCYYLPHHAIIKETSTTTQTRVVFNGSAETTSGLSLNDTLCVGPTIQSDLFSLLLRFRPHVIAFTADIEKMYRQIAVAANDTDFQRIVWRENPTDTLKHFRLVTVTYGTASAPFVAIRSLHQLVNDAADTFPIAAKSIREDFYVDELLSGADTVADAIAVKQQLEDILESGGFHLRKWMSNSPTLIDGKDGLASVVNIEENVESIKILGLQWFPAEDYFSFKVDLNGQTSYTKRKFLSEASKIFDPLGWLSPCVILLKILFQQLWILGVDWDDLLPGEISRQWSTVRSELTEFRHIKVPRILPSSTDPIEYHGFCDASEAAYSAVIYCRWEENGCFKVRLIAAKTKVAPIRQISLPRLELCGALLLANLLDLVVNTLPHSNYKTFAWTDSTIVLAWLSNFPRRWVTYVANRTSAILSKLPRENWNHIKSEENPADCASRGMLPSLLPTYQLWWAGPTWLQRHISNWPISQDKEYSTSEEEREKPITTMHTIEDGRIIPLLLKRVSSYFKVLRIYAYCLRFVKNTRITPSTNAVLKSSGHLSTKELDAAEKHIIMCIQNDVFAEDIKKLLKEKRLDQKNKLFSLAPFIDGDGLLRVGGRLQNATCPYNAQHPIILPKNNILSKMIATALHLKYLHPGPSLLSSLIKQKYWIIDCRNLTRLVTLQCVRCVRYKAETTKQMMGNLPPERVSVSRAFNHTGVDYAGPISILSKRGRGARIIKGYLAIFVCFSTKAIHIEVVSDLTTDAFIDSLKRFVSRRGVPADIYSDNGKNFVGAKRKLSEIFQLVLSKSHNDAVSSFLTQKGINWHFIPPLCPHFGGLWEAAVKSVKHHLVRSTIGNLTFEEMATLMCQIEAILNSRPLCPVSHDDALNFDALTPGHFLVMGPLCSLPEFTDLSTDMSTSKRWQHINKQVMQFWKRYSSEYLHNLQQRRKWKELSKNLQIGDLVIVKEDNLPPGQWAMARISQTHPGDDNLVRVVTLKTSTATLKRPVTKICKLPIC